MKSQNRVLLFFASAGMELAYIYACVNFVTSAVFHRTFPLPEAVGSFLIAALLSLLSEGRGWRIIYLVAFQLLAFVPMLWRVVSILNSWSDAFMSQTWFTHDLASPADSVGYFVILLVIVWGIVFWAGGISFSSQERNYTTLCSHFDRGLIAFFAIFLIKFYFQVAMGVKVDDPLSGFLIFPFLTFSLLAIGLVRNQNSAQRDFLPGYQTVGIMLGFVVVTLLMGTGLVFFFLPYMTLAAEKGSELIGLASGPVLSLLFYIFKLLFGSDFQYQDQPEKPPEAAKQGPGWVLPGWLEIIAAILAIVVGIIIATFVLIVVGVLLYWLVLYLFSKSGAKTDKPTLRQVFASFFSHVFGTFGYLWHGLVRRLRGRLNTIQLYADLCAWGALSGLPTLLSETPSEYASRLNTRFPVFETEINSIVQAFNREVYGEMALTEQQMASTVSAWHTLASPRHWPIRVKAWFRRPPDDALQ